MCGSRHSFHVNHCADLGRKLETGREKEEGEGESFIRHACSHFFLLRISSFYFVSLFLTPNPVVTQQFECREIETSFF